MLRALSLLIVVGCGDGAALRDAAVIVEDVSLDAPADAASDALSIATGPWGTPMRVFPSSITSDDDPTLTADLLEIYFTRNGDIFMATRATTTDTWSTPVIALSTAQFDGTPEISGDGLTIHWASRRMPTLGQEDIWMATRPSRASAWGTAVHVTELSSASGDGSPTPMDTGLTLVMSSSRNGSETRLFIATRAATSDPWSTPAELTELTTGIGDFGPMLSADGKTLYYDSQISNMGDLYMATRSTTDAMFENVQVISELSTTTAGESDPWVSPDGHHILFVRHTGGIDTIWQASR